MKLLKTLLVWIIALQLLNMSICSDSYWQYFHEDHFSNSSDKQTDPTETIVEWLVEMKMGQQDAFSYNYNNIDSKTTVKVTGWQIDLENHYQQVVPNISETVKIYFPELFSKLQTTAPEILTPPPDQA